MWLRTIWHVVQSVLRVLMIELSFYFKVFLGDYEMKICSTWDSMNFLFFFVIWCWSSSFPCFTTSEQIRGLTILDGLIPGTVFLPQMYGFH